MNDSLGAIKKWLGAGSINIFGLPFSGKDTQAHRLADTLNGVFISSGEILRSQGDNSELQQILASGGIPPSDLFESSVVPYLSRPELSGRPLMLSSVGRAHGEEPVIMHTAEQAGHPLRLVIYLTMPESMVWQRFDESQARHDRVREDDRHSVIQERLDEFNLKTTPVIDFYREQGLLVEIDGTASPEVVSASIMAALAARATI